jgi:hypothetical protein
VPVPRKHGDCPSSHASEKSVGEISSPPAATNPLYQRPAHHQKSEHHFFHIDLSVPARGYTDKQVISGIWPIVVGWWRQRFSASSLMAPSSFDPN